MRNKAFFTFTPRLTSTCTSTPLSASLSTSRSVQRLSTSTYFGLHFDSAQCVAQYKPLGAAPLTFLLFTLTLHFLSAQSPVLDAYIREGLAANLNLRNSELAVQQSAEQIRQAKGLMYPSVRFEASYTRAAGGRSIDIPVGDLMNPVYSTLNQLTQSNQFPQIENVSEQFLPDGFHDTRFRVVQPLYNTDIRYNKRLREESAAIPRAAQEVQAVELRYDITKAYLQYLQTLEAARIYRSSKSVVEELHRVTQRLVANDKATPDATYNTEYELSKLETDIVRAEKNTALAGSYFNFLLQRDLEMPLIADTLFFTAPLEPIEPLDLCVQQAIANRKEPDQLGAAMQVNSTLLAMQESNRKMPTLALAFDAGAQGFGYKFNSEQWYALGALQLTWPIFSGYQKVAKEQETRLQGLELANQYELLRQQIRLQVTQAWQERYAAEKALEQAHKSVESTRSAFRIVQRKYEEQQAIQLELFDARNKYTTAQVALSIARLEAQVRQAELKRAMGVSF
jgi:outer membrane protein